MDSTFTPFYDQIEELLAENEELDPEYRIPLEEFSLNIQKLESLRQALRDREESVVQLIEEQRLERQLKCHYLKEVSWNSFQKVPVTLCSSGGELSVQNYALKSLIPPADQMKLLSSRLKELVPNEENDDRDFLNGDSKETWKKYKKFASTAILHSQYDMTNQQKINEQIVYLNILKVRYKEEFNTSFDAQRQRKSKVISEIKELVQLRKRLKKELQTIYSNDNELQTKNFVQNELENDDDENIEAPEWFPEERPEKLLYVKDDELSGQEEKMEDYKHKEALETFSISEVKTSDKEKLKYAVQSDFQQSQLTHRMYGELDSPWPWIESQAKRLQKYNEEKGKSNKNANVSKLQLQFLRIKPTIESLKNELDQEVQSLSFQKFQTDSKIQMIEILLFRLSTRLDAERDVQVQISTLKDKNFDLQLKEEKLEEEMENLERKKAKSESKVDQFKRALKDESVAVQRAFINLPIDSYKYIFALYKGASENDANEMETNVKKQKSDEAGKLEIGPRSWKQLSKFQKRKQDIEKDLQEATVNQMKIHNEVRMKNEEKQAITNEMATTQEEIDKLNGELKRFEENLEIFLKLPMKSVKMDTEEMIKIGIPDFSDLKLISSTELTELKKKAGRKVHGGGFKPIDQLQYLASKISKLTNETGKKLLTDRVAEQKSTKCKSELEYLVKERDKLSLQVELAEERLTQITHIKIGRELNDLKEPKTAVLVTEEKGKPESSQFYDTILKLQSFQERELSISRQKISKDSQRLKKSRNHIEKLQKEIDELTEDIEGIQRNQLLTTKKQQLEKEKRMQQIAAVQKSTTQLKGKEQYLQKLEDTLQKLSVRTYPMLPDRSQDL